MSNDVFFLGSGFSKAIDNNYPILSELSKEIQNNLSTEKKSVGIHYREEIPTQYKSNIETLLTFLSSKLPYKTAVQNLADETLYKLESKKCTQELAKGIALIAFLAFIIASENLAFFV